MRRRAVLALAPTLLSGCTTFGDGSPGRGPSSPTGRPPTATPTDTATATAEPTEMVEPTETETDEPTPTEGPPPELIPAQPKSTPAAEIQDRVRSVSCDGLSDLSIVCGDGSDRFGVSLSATVGSLPTDTVEFTVRNRIDERFLWNEFDWALQKWDGRGWRRIAPARIPIPGHRLEPGASHTYRITADNTTFHGQASYMERRDVTLSGLGPGVYGFRVRGNFESTPDEKLSMAGVFGLAGEGPPVRPTDAVTSVERRGDEVVVRTEDGSQGPALVVSFVEGSADATLLPEHVRQPEGLRNALSYAATEGVESIRYLGGFGVAGRAVSYLDVVTSVGTGRYRFRDYVFEVRSEDR